MSGNLSLQVDCLLPAQGGESMALGLNGELHLRCMADRAPRCGRMLPLVAMLLLLLTPTCLETG